MLVDRHLLAEWLKVFALTMGLAVSLLVLHHMYDELPDMVSFGASGGEILRFYLILIPGLLPSVMPMAFLCSLLLCLGTLHRHGEIAALRAAGLSLWRISRSLWAATLLLSAMLLYLNAAWVPWSIETTRHLYETMRLASEGEAAEVDAAWIDHLGFDNRAGGRLWMIDRFNRLDYGGFGVAVHTRDSQDREVFRLTATEAYFDEADGHWIFLDGTERRFEPDTGYPYFAKAFDRREMPGYNEDPALMTALSKRPKDLSLNELGRVLATLGQTQPARVRPYAVRYAATLASPLDVIVAASIALPLAVSGIRRSPLLNAARAVGLFIAFIVLQGLFGLLAARDLVAVPLAIAIPSAAGLATGLALLWKAR